KALLLYRAFEDVPRQDGYAGPKELQERRVDVGGRDLDRQIIEIGDGERLAIDQKLVTDNVVDVCVVDYLPGERYIVRSQRFAIAPAQAFSQLERPGFLVVGH